MNSLTNQIMSCLLDSEDKGKTLLLDGVVSRFSSDQSSAQVVDGLFASSIILLCKKSAQGVVHSSYIEKNSFPETCATRTGGVVKYSLISSKAFWQASSHMKEMPYFINRVKVGNDLKDLE